MFGDDQTAPHGHVGCRQVSVPRPPPQGRGGGGAGGADGPTLMEVHRYGHPRPKEAGLERVQAEFVVRLLAE